MDISGDTSTNQEGKSGEMRDLGSRRCAPCFWCPLQNWDFQSSLL